MTELLIDGNNLAVRAAYAPKQAMVGGGVDTGTLTLFVSMLSKYVKKVNPTHGLVAFDGGSSAWRRALFPDYKIDRKKRHEDEPTAPFALIKTFLTLAGIPHLELPGYEGDDIIAAVHDASGSTRKHVIVSGDKDLLQLCGKNTTQYRFHPKVRFDRWDHVRIKEEFGVPVESFALYLSLVGDNSDGIRGVEGIGPKRAAKLIRECDQSLERVLRKLPDQAELIKTNLALIDLRDIPLTLQPAPELLPTQAGQDRWVDLLAFCDQYELNSLKEKLENEEVSNLFVFKLFF